MDELLSLLQEEMKLYRELVIILKRERRDIVDLSLDKLYESIKEKETCILKLRILEERGSILLKAVFRKLNFSQENATISDLIGQVEEPYFSDLNICHSNLKKLANSISGINQENGRFIEHSLACTNSSLSLLNYLNSPNPTYLPSGQVKNGDKNIGAISKEI